MHWRSKRVVGQLGLSTVCRIDSLTVPVYGSCHHVIKAFGIFVLYMATAQLQPYFTAIYCCKYGYS